MESAKKIARGLSEAQRAFLLDLPANGDWIEYSDARYGRFGPNALRGFGQSGLIEGRYRNPATTHRLTRLGSAVRQHLVEAESA